VMPSNGDVRQAMHSMQLWQGHAPAFRKDATLNPFQALTRLFTKNASLDDKTEAYHVDDFLVPLMVQENYLTACKSVDEAAKAAEEISQSEEIRNTMLQDNAWVLMPHHAFRSTVMPATCCLGCLSSMGNRFPTLLGKSSTQKGRQKILDTFVLENAPESMKAGRTGCVLYLAPSMVQIHKEELRGSDFEELVAVGRTVKRGSGCKSARSKGPGRSAPSGRPCSRQASSRSRP